LNSSGRVTVDSGRVSVDWYLWEGERPAIVSYAKKSGYVAIRYKDELFQLTSNKAYFRWFGIIEGKVQQNLTLVLEPQHYQLLDGRWGVHPDQSRNRLIFTGKDEKGVELPLSDWGLEFVGHMPAPILAAIRKARAAFAGSIDDEDYRKRLQDKFGMRWKIKELVRAREGEEGQPAADTGESVAIFEGGNTVRLRLQSRRVKVLRTKVSLGGTDRAVERNTRVDVPKYRFSNAAEFEKPWHLAMWAPNDPEGQTVVINKDSPILEEVVEYHRNQYPDVYADEVLRIVDQVFGEVATCKIAHSQKLAKKMPEEELNRDYRSEQALTIALMGLMAEESLIAHRLGKLGRKKAGAPVTVAS
jgi:hypothetical protein